MKLKISELVKKGKKDKILIKIKSLGDQEIEATPLTRRQWKEVEDIESLAVGDIETIQKQSLDRKGFRKKSKKERRDELEQELKMKLNVSDQVNQSVEAQTHAIFLSLSPNDPELLEEDIQDVFNTEQFDEIYDKILEISGITTNDEDTDEMVDDLEDFPGDR